MQVSDHDRQKKVFSFLKFTFEVVLFGLQTAVFLVGFVDPSSMCLAQEGPPQDAMRLPMVSDPPQPGVDANPVSRQNGSGATGQAAVKRENGSSGDQNEPPAKEKDKQDDKDKEEENAAPQHSNFHAQATAVAQGDPGFPAKYSGFNSLNPAGGATGNTVGRLVCWCAAVAWCRDARRCPDVAGLRP